MAVVNSKYRNAGVFDKMMARTYSYVRDEAKGKVFIGGCTTAHPYSQKLRLKYGSTPCAFFFNIIPPGLLDSGLVNKESFTSEAVAASVFDFTSKTFYLPTELKEMAQLIYGA